jgi:hypothetical protein
MVVFVARIAGVVGAGDAARAGRAAFHLGNAQPVQDRVDVLAVERRDRDAAGGQREQRLGDRLDRRAAAGLVGDGRSLVGAARLGHLDNAQALRGRDLVEHLLGSPRVRRRTRG